LNLENLLKHFVYPCSNFHRAEKCEIWPRNSTALMRSGFEKSNISEI